MVDLSPRRLHRPVRRHPGLFLAGLLLAGLALAACSGTDTHEDGPGAGRDALDALSIVGLTGADARAAIDTLDAQPMTERPEGIIASVRADHLVVGTAGGEESTLPLPDDEFYLSVAPYREQTHDCFFHSLTTCVGELSDTPVQITLTTDDGDVLVDEERTTFDNGFVGLWLPRDITGTLTISTDDATGSIPIGTGADDPTCLTTLRLT